MQVASSAWIARLWTLPRNAALRITFVPLLRKINGLCQDLFDSRHGGSGTFFLRLTLYTCAFYLAFALPLAAAELAVTYWKGGFGIFFSGRSGIAAFVSFWGLVWLVSFLLAFRIVFPFVWSRLLS